MSVAIHDNHQLRALANRLLTYTDAIPQTVFEVVLGLGIANRAAHMMSYPRDPQPLERPDLEVDVTEVDGEDDVVEWSRNLLYNCVTNNGIDFAPALYARQLMQLANAAQRRVCAATENRHIADAPSTCERQA